MANTTLKVGDKVYFGRTHGEKTLGEVVKVNRVKLRVKQLEQRGTLRDYKIGTLWTVPVSLCSPADGSAAAAPTPAKPKLPEAEVMHQIRRLYSMLSPENLHMDGEISRTAAARRGRAINRELRACFQELGREVSETEAFAGL